MPFASTGIHGLCDLNVWWMKLGIIHQRIRPARPKQNGQHERMHRDMESTREAAVLLTRRLRMSVRDAADLL